MHSKLYRRLEQLDHLDGRQALHGGLVGLEKESLRVTLAGKLSQLPHPVSLGSALTHPQITTDYSEALLELITPPRHSIDETLVILDKLHRFVYPHIGDEFLWAASMPCVLEGEDNIPIAYYGESNIGKMKHIYRRGLGYRYGKVMQVIAGVHFNFSFSNAFWTQLRQGDQSRQKLPAYISENYVALTRNFLRYVWLIPYLFGASPAVCKSFFGARESGLAEWDESTVYGPFATSLRISDFGYQNRKACEPERAVKYDSLSAYIESLKWLINTPHPDYHRFGVKVADEYRQLNANWLQIENEYYSPVRLKQICGRGEKPVDALRDRGVQYLEIRALDINVFQPLGVCDEQLRFLQLLLLYCLLQESPPIGVDEYCAIDRNLKAVAIRGRDPELSLQRQAKQLRLTQWANEICHHLEPIAELLDADSESAHYQQALRTQQNKIDNPEATPSARVLAEMRDHEEGFFQFAMRKSRQYKNEFLARPLPAEEIAELVNMAQNSLAEQRALEAAETQDFDSFLAEYLAT